MDRALDALEDRFRAAVSPDLPAVAWGVWRGGRVWTGAAGATPQTPFSLASVTKPMTAHAAMLLVQRGMVDLAAPVSRYLEAPLDGDVEEATVGRVLAHTAGLPPHYQFFYSDEPFVPPPFAETIRRYGKTFWAPGSRYAYSNLGYGLLDHLIERVSGRPYAEFMREEVFLPLGMAGASIGPSEGSAVPHGRGFAYPPYGFDHPGASAAFASVEDLLAFGRFHLDPGPFSPMRVSVADAGPGRGYGLGWGIDARGFVEHTGGMGGVRSVLRLVPELGLVVALVASGETDLVGQAADAAVAAVAPGFPLSTEGRSRPPEALPEGLRGGWRGTVETYRGDVTLPVEIDGSFEARDGRVFGVMDGDVGTEDAGRRPYRLHLDLALVAGGLEGAATAVSTQGQGERLGNALSYRCRLERVP